MNAELYEILENAKTEIPAVVDSQKLSELYNKYVGKTGLLTSIMKNKPNMNRERHIIPLPLSKR